jgi:hypothetical protein
MFYFLYDMIPVNRCKENKYQNQILSSKFFQSKNNKRKSIKL